MRRIQLQLVFVLFAAISVAALSAVLITSAIQGAEGVVIEETRRALRTAGSELEQQYAYRIADDGTWGSLPESAQDISLRAISQAALRSYPGMEGGFSIGSQILGYSYPTHDSGTLKTDIPESERGQIEAAIQTARRSGNGERVLRGTRDLVMIEALCRECSPEKAVSWTMKRVTGIRDAGERRRSTLLIGLVFASFVSVMGTLAAAMGLRQGMAEIQHGLSRLETDFAFELPVVGGELGRISRSINRVAGTRRKLEAELRRADRLSAIGRMAANIAHEIRNPLNGIRLSMQVVKQKLGKQEIRTEDVKLVMDEVDRLNTLLTELLKFREARPPHLEEATVRPIVERCARLMEGQARERAVEIRVHEEVPEARAWLDEAQLTQVLTNLFLNALKAVSESGAVDVRIRPVDGEVLVEMQDTGPGVRPENRERIFEPFYTTAEGGTGLGLAVSSELMRAMGGALEYRDDQAGATFVIRLPREKTFT